MAKKEHKDSKKEFVNNAVNEGINAILKDHPVFGESRDYIAKHIDMRRLGERINEIYDEITEKHKYWNDRRKLEYMHHAIADYVATGNAFDERGQETIFRKSLEERAGNGFLKGIFARRELKGERELERKLVAYHHLYDVVEKSGLSEEVPEVYEALKRMRILGGTVAPAIESMKYDGLINEKTYRAYKRNIKESVAINEPIIHKGLENYVTPQKVAAMVLGVFGIVSFALKANITGGVISNYMTSDSFFLGIFSVVVALLLFFIQFNPRKKAVRKNKFKN
jgi:hypothetical protein